MKTNRNPSTVPPPLASYAHQIEVTGPQRWLVLSGQVGMRPDGALPSDPIEQLEAAGMRRDDLVRLTTYLVGDVDAEGRRKAMNAWLGDHAPATLVPPVRAEDLAQDPEGRLRAPNRTLAGASS